MKLMHRFITATFCLSLCLWGCSKKKTESPQPQVKETPKAKQGDSAGSTEADKAIEDVNDFINNGMGNGGNKRLSDDQHRLEAYNLPCGVVRIDSATTMGGRKVYRMKYGDQNRCGYKKKSGEVAFHLISGNAFNEQGAKYQIQFTDYTVIVLATNDVIKLNGSLVVTNVSGGYVWESVVNGSTISHSVKGSYNITYTNGETRPRKYYQLRTWKSDKSWATLTFTVTGDTLIDSKKISETGYTLEGNHPFQTEISEDFVWGNCGSTFTGPYVLQKGHARMNLTVPNISPAYFDLEAGYRFTLNTLGGTSVKDCNSNAYKVQVKLGSIERTEYQLY